jgi:hypothetical protein
MPIRNQLNNRRALVEAHKALPANAEIVAIMPDRQKFVADLDPPTFQGTSSWMLPIPATFVVSQDGLIRARFIDPDHCNRMMISDMLAAML